MSIKVFSETGKLKKVLLHRPGKELLNLMPDYLGEMLFDDIPWLEMAQKEHDAFADTLREQGATVVYLRDLVEQSLYDEQVKKEFVAEFIAEATVYSEKRRNDVRDFLLDRPCKDMIDVMISGIRKTELPYQEKRHLVDYLEDDYPFVIPPMPNTYFMRDGFACVGNGVVLCKMHTRQRARETLFGKYIFRYHPDYADTPLYYDRKARFDIEGGDILVLNDKTLAVGISQRTHATAVETLARNVLGKGFEQILAIDIPKQRTFMHLDTVFTMVGKHSFSVHPYFTKKFSALSVTSRDGELNFKPMSGDLQAVLSEVLCDDVKLIKCGGDSVIDSAREQWNDGANTLAVDDNKVVVYSRNQVTNRLFEKENVTVLPIPCSELSRGRGGPRCMAMPLIRE